MDYDKVNRARNMVIDLHGILVRMFDKDPDAEIRAPSIHVVDEAPRLSASYFPGDPIIAAVQDCFSPEALEAGENPTVGDVLPAVTILRALLISKTSELQPPSEGGLPDWA